MCCLLEKLKNPDRKMRSGFLILRVFILSNNVAISNFVLFNFALFFIYKTFKYSQVITIV
ncbi:hypothetical protein B0A63_21630 [Flavobacterium johnsoniae UW101]|nr:hypothetical protein B0A63_21630 [Flavobacterium johnsoniae UW101]